MFHAKKLSILLLIFVITTGILIGGFVFGQMAKNANPSCTIMAFMDGDCAHISNSFDMVNHHISILEQSTNFIIVPTIYVLIHAIIILFFINIWFSDKNNTATFLALYVKRHQPLCARIYTYLRLRFYFTSRHSFKKTAIYYLALLPRT